MSTEYFLNSRTGSQWKLIDVKKRAGLVVPLFSVWSGNKTIGEFTDINLLTDWSRLCGLSIIQLLPLNDMGSDNSPYNSVSSFALDPVYINLSKLKEVSAGKTRKIISSIKFENLNTQRVNYRIKRKKLNTLRKIFTEAFLDSEEYSDFKHQQSHWLDSYALFKLIKSHYNGKHWETWDRRFRNIDSLTVKDILKHKREELNFIAWVQWQAYNQLKEAKLYAEKNSVLLMGDLSYLVSSDSADVWQNPDYFKLDKVAGAPPDMYMQKGQRWGMSPYNWMNIAIGGFTYIRDRLKYAENFYHSYRIDHFIGLLRIWTISKNISESFGGEVGQFDPADENIWKQHGREIVNEFISASSMLPVAEDLGTVPNDSFELLHELGIPGMEVLRWKRNWSDGGSFVNPEFFRENSISVLSTHDSSTISAWWKFEAGKTDLSSFYKNLEQYGISREEIQILRNKLFKKYINPAGRVEWRAIVSPESINEFTSNFSDNVKYYLHELYKSTIRERTDFASLIGYNCMLSDEINVNFIRNCLQTALGASSIFSIQLLMEWLYLDGDILKRFSKWRDRINFPGTVSNLNWTWRLPISLEDMMKSEVIKIIKTLVEQSGRGDG